MKFLLSSDCNSGVKFIPHSSQIFSFYSLINFLRSVSESCGIKYFYKIQKSCIFFDHLFLKFLNRPNGTSLSIRDLSQACNTSVYGPKTSRKPYARRRSHTYARYYVSQTRVWRSYIRQERRALVATAVFHFALKPRAPRILLIRYIRKLIVIRWSRVYTREPPASPSCLHPPPRSPTGIRTALVHAYFP